MAANLRCLWMSMWILPLVLSACRGGAGDATPTPDPNMVLTAAAETASVRLTEQAQPVNTPTLTSTHTPLPTTPASSATASPTITVMPTTLVPGTSSRGDRAAYVADITVPDGTDFAPGEAFAKVWRIQNIGTTTWNTNYALAFLGGVQMGGPAAVPLTRSVAPGGTVDISVNLVAPQEMGTHRGFWEMRNAGGALFPEAVFVEIDVVRGTPQPSPTITTTSSSDARVTDITLSVDEPDPDVCPHRFLFTASFTLNMEASVTYELVAGTDTPGFTFKLPGKATGVFRSGEHTLSYIIDVSDTVEAWAEFHVEAPNAGVSNRVGFSLECP